MTGPFNDALHRALQDTLHDPALDLTAPTDLAQTITARARTRRRRRTAVTGSFVAVAVLTTLTALAAVTASSHPPHQTSLGDVATKPTSPPSDAPGPPPPPATPTSACPVAQLTLEPLSNGAYHGRATVSFPIHNTGDVPCHLPAGLTVHGTLNGAPYAYAVTTNANQRSFSVAAKNLITVMLTSPGSCPGAGSPHDPIIKNLSLTTADGTVLGRSRTAQLDILCGDIQVWGFANS